MTLVILILVLLAGFTTVKSEAYQGKEEPRFGRRAQPYRVDEYVRSARRAFDGGPAGGTVEFSTINDPINLDTSSQVAREPSSQDQIESNEQIQFPERTGSSDEFRAGGLEFSEQSQGASQSLEQGLSSSEGDSIEQLSQEGGTDSSGLAFGQVSSVEESLTKGHEEQTAFIPEEMEFSGPVTKDEIAREFELLSQDIKEAEREKGAPLDKKDMEELETNLEKEPWYRRLNSAVFQPVAKFFKGVFGGRRKR